ncbi:glycosyltransferase family A protein [Jeongeupia sp. USM3]|uniref:glycosyltransferase family 2 protein n=1 Tax=Jeongeupia sp. USM3 TaxID=1906741 RepID=UPI00089DD71B|nr:glycosyltransferase family A protein [Jeongeupia sp. USM3]AOY01582.1 hypothetical protein BJP62_14650 [Jeongeupia sp. USM3]
MRLSVLLPYFNTPWPLLRAQLDSISAADLRGFAGVELVLVDDGSASTLADAVDAWAGRAPFAVRHLRHDGNRGLANALNTAMAQATGDWLAFADGDDLTHPRRFAVQAAYLSAHPDLVAAGADMVELAPDGTRGRCRRFPVDDAAIRVELLFYCAMAQPALMLRRAAWAALDVWRTPGTGMAEDWDFFVRLAGHGRLGSCGQPLVDYRLHPAQMTATLSAATPHPAVLALWRRQLAAMGVDVDDGLLAVHAALSPYWLWPYGDPAVRLPADDVHHWHAALLAANAASGRYDPDWLAACLAPLRARGLAGRGASYGVPPERLFGCG